MSIFQKRQVQTLPEWLEIATRKLTDASKERIRLEIEAHYLEAVQAHREVGLPEVDAQTKAVTELGDPKAAARRFRKQHITEREHQRLKTSEKKARSIWILIFSYAYFGQTAFDWLPHRHHPLTRYRYGWLGLALEFVFFIAFPTIRIAIARFGKTNSSGHLALPDFTFSFVVLGIGLNDLLTTGFTQFEVYLNTFYGLIFLIYYILGIRLWIKLRKAGAISVDPPGTAHA